MTQWDQSSCVPDQDLLPTWAMSQLSDWVKKYNHNEHHNHTADAAAPTVEVGMGFDLWFLPKDVVLPMLTELGEKGLRVLTTHVGCNAFQGKPTKVRCYLTPDADRDPQVFNRQFPYSHRMAFFSLHTPRRTRRMHFRFCFFRTAAEFQSPIFPFSPPLARRSPARQIPNRTWAWAILSLCIRRCEIARLQTSPLA